MKERFSTKKIVITAMFASLACVATMIIKIPSPLKGYINIGDCVVLLSGYALSPVCAFIAAGLGSALADLFSGYAVYVPATFVIKGLMALVVCYGCRLSHKKVGKSILCILSALLAELIMAAGYLTFEGFLYGFAASAVNIPANCVQGAAGFILGLVLIKIFEKSKISF